MTNVIRRFTKYKMVEGRINCRQVYIFEDLDDNNTRITTKMKVGNRYITIGHTRVLTKNQHIKPYKKICKCNYYNYRV